VTPKLRKLAFIYNRTAASVNSRFISTSQSFKQLIYVLFTHTVHEPDQISLTSKEVTKLPLYQCIYVVHRRTLKCNNLYNNYSVAEPHFKDAMYFAHLQSHCCLLGLFWYILNYVNLYSP